MDSIDAVVLCGGRGSRLGRLTAATPKPLLPLDEHPFLYHRLIDLRRAGVRRVIFAAWYLAEQFYNFMGRYAGLVDELELIVEPEPLGTGGALRHAVQAVRTATCLVVNGDSVVTQLLQPVLAFHRKQDSDFTIIGVESSQVIGGARNKGQLQFDAANRLVGFQTLSSAQDGWINAGVYIAQRDAVLAWPQGRYDLEPNLLSLLDGRRAVVFRSAGSLVDIGTPELYQWAAQQKATEGLVTA